MNIKKILCLSLAFGSILSLTSCSNIKDIMINSSIEQNKPSQEDNEINKMNNKIKESIINQLKTELDAYKGQPLELDEYDRIKLPIQNDTEYIITMSSFHIIIEDEKGKDTVAGLFMEDCIFLEPGQKCYVSLMVESNFTGVKDIKDYSLSDNILGVENQEYTVMNVDVSNIKFNKNDKGRFGTISCTVKNNTENSYAKGLIYVEYKDKDGYIYNNLSTLAIPEFTSKESYPVEMIVRNAIEDKNNITFKIRFKN